MERPSGQQRSTWRIGSGREMRLDRPRIMGIVNATPDSFSDGGRLSSLDALVGHALRLVEEGADVIDVGGESTRPGARRVPAKEQIARTLPVIRELSRCSGVPVSIDTTSADVARAALDEGAVIVNDVSAGRDDAGLLELAAERACGLVLMHRRSPPAQESYSDEYAQDPHYDDVVATVIEFLMDRCAEAVAMGVARSSIVVDPGLGFGKTVRQNCELVGRARELVGTNYPVLGAASRKSFVGAVTGVSAPSSRVIGSTAVSVLMYAAGVRIFRVHDVGAHREALAAASAVDRAARPATPDRPSAEPVG